MSDWHLDITGALAGISLLGVWGCGGQNSGNVSAGAEHWGLCLSQCHCCQLVGLAEEALRANWGQRGIWLCCLRLTDSQCKLLGLSWSNSWVSFSSCHENTFVPACNSSSAFSAAGAESFLPCVLLVSLLVSFRATTDHGEGGG